ncbi:unconventional prefoldin RPB5 interactor-like protein [Drosophila eugracilis]|uniref:unconventional prefoldin RPB5 interactor-like protein n=1 Tax=Drosophila eugracilis TaxID=29029 RepID=UPI001BDA437E|nr:unconventional prefoldin RPB5 interactor-like protein [Drosophila eugracilis]
MDRREDALLQALDKNASETERWQAFKADNESTIRNLDMFAKNLSVEVMVPIGRKALMPGELIHTNELLVGHYEGYFSACSAHKAKEICRHRLKLAEEQLKKLEIESDLWQNKLNTPLTEGAVPRGEQVEIVEDFNEESHSKWMTEHRERVRQQKQMERIKRQAEPPGSDDEVLRKLEEREMMEELGLDPDNINQEQLQNLLNEEPKESITITSKPLTEEQESELWKKLEAAEQNETEDLSTEAEESLRSTDNLVRQLMSGEAETLSTKKRIGGVKKPLEIEERVPDDDDDDGDQEEVVQTIREQMSLLPSEERESFLRDQLQVLKAKMRKIQKVNFISDELIHLMNVVVMLEDDLQDLIFDQELEASEEEEVDENEPPASHTEEPKLVPEASTNKRRISFALADEKLEFRREETVAEMLPNARKNSKDIIKLDEPVQALSEVQKAIVSKKDTKTNSDILQKVERNIEFVKENQSVQDFDLLNRILEESTGLINTLHISFTHSNAVPSPKTDPDDAIPVSPADFYDKYEKNLSQRNHSFPIYVNGFEGEEQVKVPIMSEASRGSAYEDPRSQFSKITYSEEKSSETEAITKSILRNKAAVELEPHVVNQQPKKGRKGRKNKKKERTLEDDLRDMSAYQKVMHDLVEKEPTAPEPLPQGKFIDSHAPKKRVSRFKAQRDLNKM